MSKAYASLSDIDHQVNNVSLAKIDLAAAAQDQQDLTSKRKRLQHEAKKLVELLEEPNDAVWPRVFQVNVSISIEIMSQLKLWEQFSDGKELDLHELVALSGADEIILVRVFRQLVAANLFAESTLNGMLYYKLTPLGQPYLNSNHRAFNNFVYQDLLPSIMAMPRTLAENGYRAPGKEFGTVFQWKHGEELWTWMGSHPDRAANMVAAVTSHNELSAYPWAQELADRNLTDDDITVVDIGGGQGHIVSEVRRNNPQLKGRFIVQDLASTLEAITTPLPGIAFMTYDIFTPQPVKDASIYHYRHIFHNWSDDDCSVILAQIYPILKGQPTSKLLIVDVVLPDTNISMQEAIMDITMFPMGGMERTESQWRKLLSKSGLGIKKIWRGSEPEACIECGLL